MSSKNLPSSDAPWLDEFTLFLTSRSDRVYNNGRQQIEVTLLLVAVEGQSITEAQYDSITLTYQNEDGEWIALSDVPAPGDWFYQTTHDPRYDYFPSLADLAVPVELPGAQNTARFKRFYVQTTAAAGSSIRLAGRIEQQPDQLAYTQGDAATVLYSEPSPTYTFPEDYHWQRTSRVGDRLFSHATLRSDRFILEYALRPKQVAFSVAQFIAPDHEARHLVRWDDTQPEFNLATLVSVALPGSDRVAYASHVVNHPRLADRLMQHVVSPSDGQIVIVAQGTDDVPRTLSQSLGHQPVKVQAYDRFGAQHQLAIDFASVDTRFEIAAECLHSPQTLDVSNITYFKVSGRGLAGDAITCKLYNNVWQQTYIEVLLEAVDSQGAVVRLPDEVLKAVTLVDYETGERLSNQFDITTTRSAIDERFIYYPDQLPGTAEPAPAEAAQRVTFYIGTDARENKRVAARLAYNGKTYHTHDKTRPGGEGHTSSGRSNCSAIIVPVLQDYFLSDQKFFTLPRYDASDSKAPKVIDIDRYELQLKRETGHRLVYHGRQGTLCWDYVGYERTHWIYQLPFTGQRQTTVSKGAINQTLNYTGEASCYSRLSVNAVWIEGESNYDIGYRHWYYDESGHRHYCWVTTRDKMNILEI